MSRFGPPVFTENRSGEILGNGLADAIGAWRSSRRQKTLDAELGQEREVHMASMGAFPTGTQRIEEPTHYEDPFAGVSPADLHSELARMPIRTTPTAPAAASPGTGSDIAPETMSRAFESLQTGDPVEGFSQPPQSDLRDHAPTHPGAFDPGTREFGGSVVQQAMAAAHVQRGGATAGRIHYQLPSGVDYDPENSEASRARHEAMADREHARVESAAERRHQLALAEAFRQNDIAARADEQLRNYGAEQRYVYRPNADGTLTALPTRGMAPASGSAPMAPASPGAPGAPTSGAPLAGALGAIDTGVRVPPPRTALPRQVTGTVNGRTMRGTIDAAGNFKPDVTAQGDTVFAPPPRPAAGGTERTDMPLVHQLSTVRAQIAETRSALALAEKAAAKASGPLADDDKAKQTTAAEVARLRARRDSLVAVQDNLAAEQQRVGGGGVAPSAGPPLRPASQSPSAAAGSQKDPAARARELHDQGKPREEVLRIMRGEGYNVVDSGRKP